MSNQSRCDTLCSIYKFPSFPVHHFPPYILRFSVANTNFPSISHAWRPHAHDWQPTRNA